MKEDLRKSFAGKTVWITGAETIIGRKAATMFLSRGAKLLLSGISSFDGGASDDDIICYEHNPTDEENAANALKLVENLDVTVITNRYIRCGTLTNASHEEFDDIIEQNLTHAWCAARATAGKIGKTRGGAIVLINSIHGEKPSASAPLFSVACGGINMLVKEAAQDFGRLGIRVNQVRCGALEGDDELFKSDISDLYEDFEERVPRQKFGSPEEVVKAAMFLCSEDASFVNGATLTTDGGFLGFYVYGNSHERWDIGYV